MRAKFIYESLESYLEPKSEDEIVHSLSNLSKKELGMKLIDAAESGLTDIVQYIINAGADVNVSDDDGWTALHYASNNVHEQIVKMLLKAGADVNAKNNVRRTALQMASYKGHEQIVKMLFKAGADVTAKDQYGWTALHWASYHGRASIVKLLKSYGAKE